MSFIRHQEKQPQENILLVGSINELLYLFYILKKVKTNTVLILTGMACVWLVNWTRNSGLQRSGRDTTLPGSKGTSELSELKLPSPNFQHCTLGPSEAQWGISAPSFLLVPQNREPDISKTDAFQRNYMYTTHIYPFSFAALSYCQYLQGCQVAALHAKQVIQKCYSVFIASLWIQNGLWGQRVGGMLSQQLQKQLCHNF